MSLAILPLKREKLRQQSHFIEARVENKLHGFSKQMNLPKRDWIQGCFVYQHSCVCGVYWRIKTRQRKLSEIVCGNVQT